MHIKTKRISFVVILLVFTTVTLSGVAHAEPRFAKATSISDLRRGFQLEAQRNGFKTIPPGHAAIKCRLRSQQQSNSATVPVPQRGFEKRHAEKVALARQHRYDLLMIGDSITHNFEEAEYQSAWQQFFAPRNALNLGYGGARTENILWNLSNGELDNQSPKVVTLLIGTNNSDDANYPVVNNAEEILEGTAAIVKLLREKLPVTKILLLRIFPRTNFYRNADGSERGSAQKRSATNLRAGELVKTLADNKHVFYLDVNSVFLRPDGSIDAQLMPDLLHPSPAGALVWARAMEPLLAKLFGDKPH